MAYELPYSTAASSGQTIALVDAYGAPTIEGDLGVYDQQFGLPPCTSAGGCLRVVDEHGGTDYPPLEAGWAAEQTLDVEMAHAICDECHLLLVEAASPSFSDLEAAVATAVRLGATEVSNSYTGEEWLEVSSSGYDHPGVVITAASGDCGYLDSACGPAGRANFPASSPDVVAVSGTTLTRHGSLWESSAWSGAGSGCSSYLSAPSWQAGAPGISSSGCGTSRAASDVSAVANPHTGVAVYDSSLPGAEAGWGQWGGTSAASPIVAGEFALAGGARGVSYPAQTLYEHVGATSAFLDVTEGQNGSCSGRDICTAGTGWDGPTGLGSPLGLEAFAVITQAPVSTEVPQVSGEAQEGASLTGTSGAWSGAPEGFAYQWQRSEGSSYVALEGATSPAYALTTEDVGHSVRLEVAATNAGGTVDALSQAVSVSPAPTSPSPSGPQPSEGVSPLTPLAPVGTSKSGGQTPPGQEATSPGSGSPSSPSTPISTEAAAQVTSLRVTTRSRGRGMRGMAASWRMGSAGTVTLTIERASCHKGLRGCVLTIVHRPAKEGVNSIALSALLGDVALRPGAYALLAQARSSEQASRAPFSVT